MTETERFDAVFDANAHNERVRIIGIAAQDAASACRKSALALRFADRTLASVLESSARVIEAAATCSMLKAASS